MFEIWARFEARRALHAHVHSRDVLLDADTIAWLLIGQRQRLYLRHVGEADMDRLSFLIDHDHTAINRVRPKRATIRKYHHLQSFEVIQPGHDVRGRSGVGDAAVEEVSLLL